MKKTKLTVIAINNSDDTSLCAGGKCPAIYRSEDGRIFVQGNSAPEDVSRAVNVPKGEALIEVPESLLKKLLATL